MKKLLAHLVLVGAVSASTLAFGGDISITGGATKSVVGSQDEVYYEWTDTANPGTITIPEGGKLVDILLVGGGGAGGFCRGGGGGGGGVVYRQKVALAAGTYDVIVGAGGIPDALTPGSGDYARCYYQDQTTESANGTSSQLKMGGSVLVVGGVSFEAFGGGGGGNYHDKKKNVQGAGLSGACGGGAAANFTQYATGGIAGQGYAGGKGATNNQEAGGGGGAGAAGANGPGNGGAGLPCAITGESVAYGGGGGGGAYAGGSQTSGGADCGGLGGSKYEKATAGKDGFGGGGGGASGAENNWDMCGGGTGGSGVVIIRELPAVANPPVVEKVQTVTVDDKQAVTFHATLVKTGTQSDGMTPSASCMITLAIGTDPDALPEKTVVKSGWTLDEAVWTQKFEDWGGAVFEFGTTYYWAMTVSNADGAAAEELKGSFFCASKEQTWTYDADAKTISNGDWVFNVTVNGTECTITSKKTVGTNGLINFKFLFPCTGLTLVDISGDGMSLFQNNTIVEEVIFPNSLRRLGAKTAFYNASNLKRVVLPETMDSIGKGCFYNCAKLEEIVNVIPEGVQFADSEGDKAGMFSGNSATSATKIKTIRLPSTLTLIGNYAFQQCKDIVEFVMPEDNKFPSGMTYVGQNAFQLTSALKEAVFDDKVPVVIDNYAFHGLQSLTNVVIPAVGSTIGEAAFMRNHQLKMIDIGGVVSVSKTAFLMDNGTSLAESVILSPALTNIGYQAFRLLARADFTVREPLSDEKIPEVDCVIGEQAFWQCADCGHDISITIPFRGKCTIGNQAFYATPNLKTLTFWGKAPDALPDSMFAVSGISAQKQNKAIIVCPKNVDKEGWLKLAQPITDSDRAKLEPPENAFGKFQGQYDAYPHYMVWGKSPYGKVGMTIIIR